MNLALYWLMRLTKMKLGVFVRGSGILDDRFLPPQPPSILQTLYNVDALFLPRWKRKKGRDTDWAPTMYQMFPRHPSSKTAGSMQTGTTWLAHRRILCA